MALFGSTRDISTFRGISRELLENIVSQNCGYYKHKLSDTKVNIYGEASQKYFIGPVLINCLVVIGDMTTDRVDFGPTSKRTNEFRFLKYHLEQANILPEVGDVIMHLDDFFEVDNVNENEYIVGKDNQYVYEDGLENFGSSYSIILQTHLTNPESLGIKQVRL
jgi:hypothetical protein